MLSMSPLRWWACCCWSGGVNAEHGVTMLKKTMLMNTSSCSPSRFSIIRHAIQPMTNPPANSGVADHGISIDIFVGTENKLEY